MTFRLPRFFAFTLLAGLALSGCPGTSSPPAVDAGGGTDAPAAMDSGTPEVDGGGSTDDSGSTGTDGGGTTDAGSTGTDGGSTGTDAGSTGTDAGGPTIRDGGGAPACGRCNSTEYCDLCETPPMCEVRPPDEGRICPAIYMPVCGCDGMTYSNSCALASARIGLLHDGECDAPPPPAGECVDDGDCAPGQYCATCRGAGGGVNVCLPDGTVC